MTISQVWKWTLGSLSAIGVIWTGVKNVREIATSIGSLNGWEVLFILSVLGLLVVGITSCVEWLNKKFEKQDFVIRSILKTLEIDRNERLKQQQQLWDAVNELREQFPNSTSKSELS
jgi:hypothetical protein